MSEREKILDKRPSPGGLEILNKGAGGERNVPVAQPRTATGDEMAPFKNGLKKAAGGNVAEGFPHWQSRMAVGLGVAEDLVREVRAGLIEGEDWVHQGQRVLFSEKGRARVEERLQVMKSEEAGEVTQRAQSADTEGTEFSERGDVNATHAKRVERVNGSTAGATVAGAQHPAENTAQVLRMRVVKVPVNPQLVLCVPATAEGMPQGNAERVRVRVRSNVNFIPGMLLKATAIAGLPGMFSLVGACPRFRGRF